MIVIKTLRQLTQEDFNPIMVGYTSPGKYVVTRHETPERTTISLEIITLDRPYIKRWEQAAVEQQAACFDHDLSLVAFDSDQLVGLALAEPHTWNRSLWIWEFGVLASHHRQGIGRELMEELARRAVAANLRILVAETQNTNLPAIRFYRAVGFGMDGIDLSYYSNQDFPDGEVAIFMKRKLFK